MNTIVAIGRLIWSTSGIIEYGTYRSLMGYLGIVFFACTQLSVSNTFGNRVRIYTSLSSESDLHVEGPYRFLTVAGLRGFQPTSLKTKATLKTDLHKSEKGSLSLWFSPLEEMEFFGYPDGFVDRFPEANKFPLVSDAFPARIVKDMSFSVYWSGGYPQLVGKFSLGSLWGQLDFGLPAFVYGERLKLRKGSWYHVVLTWDRPSKALRIYVNGVRMGYFDEADNFGESSSKQLYIGNPAMVMRELLLENRVLDEGEIAALYESQRPEGNDLVDADIRQTVDVQVLPDLDIERDQSWTKTYSVDFKEQKDLDEWVFQTGDEYRDLFDVRTTDEGLLIRTPEIIARDTRMYLWSPESFEGDQWIEYDFRVESPNGLSLLVVCCRGPQGEDFIDDYGLEKTGSMGVILGKTVNYHWEYVRRVEIMRRDVETQYVAKNPWHWRMHYSCFPKLEQGRWYRLRFVKIGNRLHGSIDGKTVFDIMDDPSVNNGPVLSRGRIGFRQMYNTAMRYRNFEVYQRNR